MARRRRIIRREGRILVLAKVFPDGDAQEQLRRLHAELEALPADWDALLTEHVPAHRALFDRSRFELEDERFSDETLNSELLDDAYESGRCPNRLTERMWAYGRYLLVSATREGGLPCRCWDCGAASTARAGRSIWPTSIWR